jgi:hypothetical protein
MKRDQNTPVFKSLPKAFRLMEQFWSRANPPKFTDSQRITLDGSFTTHLPLILAVGLAIGPGQGIPQPHLIGG